MRTMRSVRKKLNFIKIFIFDGVWFSLSSPKSSRFQLNKARYLPGRHCIKLCAVEIYIFAKGQWHLAENSLLTLDTGSVFPGSVAFGHRFDYLPQKEIQVLFFRAVDKDEYFITGPNTQK